MNINETQPGQIQNPKLTAELPTPNTSNNELTATIIVLLINIGIIAIAIGVKYLFDFLSTYQSFYWILGGYILLYILLFLVKNKIRNDALYFSVQIILFPFTLLFKFIALILPILATQVYLLVFLGISFFIPLLLYTIDTYQPFTGLTNETWIYLITITGAITASLFHEQISFLTFKIIPFTSRRSWKKKRFKLVKLCKYIVSKRNIVLIIYSIFFITLTIFNILSLQQGSYYQNSNIDNAILQSFATFVAFERIVDNVKLTKFSPSELLKTFKLSWTKKE